MAYNTWQDIYDKKSDEELYKICKGYEYPTFEQKQMALKALEKRGFDFEKADEKIQQWRREGEKRQDEFKQEHPLLHFINQYYPLFFALMFATFCIALSSEYNKGLKEMTDEELDALRLFIASSALGCLFMILMYFMLKSKRKMKDKKLDNRIL